MKERECCGVGIHLVGSHTHSSATRSFSLPLVCSAKGTSLCPSCSNRHMIQGPRSCRTKWHFHTAASLSLSLLRHFLLCTRHFREETQPVRYRTPRLLPAAVVAGQDANAVVELAAEVQRAAKRKVLLKAAHRAVSTSPCTHFSLLV